MINAGIISKNNGKLLIFYKRNLDSNIGNCIIILTEPTTPLIFHAQPGGIFLLMGCFMYRYPKQILKIEQQVQSYADAGMEITSREEITQILLKKFTVSIMYSIRMEEFLRAVR